MAINLPRNTHRPVIAAASIAAFLLAGSIHAAQDRPLPGKSAPPPSISLQQFTAEQPGILITRTLDGRINKIAGHAFANGSSPADAAGGFIDLHAGIFGIDAAELEPGRPFAGDYESLQLLFHH